MADMQKTYDPSSVEERLYAKWEQNGYFHQEPQKGKKTFTIVMPPRTSPDSCIWDTRWTT